LIHFDPEGFLPDGFSGNNKYLPPIEGGKGQEVHDAEAQAQDPGQQQDIHQALVRCLPCHCGYPVTFGLKGKPIENS